MSTNAWDRQRRIPSRPQWIRWVLSWLDSNSCKRFEWTPREAHTVGCRSPRYMWRAGKALPLYLRTSGYASGTSYDTSNWSSLAGVSWYRTHRNDEAYEFLGFWQKLIKNGKWWMRHLREDRASESVRKCQKPSLWSTCHVPPCLSNYVRYVALHQPWLSDVPQE